ncbi:MAG: type II 3-dehydroquinate dehydratase [SAR324 cluster bacterium]|nr:type II 3-dehydroquinate dehydratase [SAR324 cluster bacterium]
MEKTVLLLNGPNLNLLGTREPEVYGHTTLKEIEQHINGIFLAHQIQCQTYQSNIEGEMINWLHAHRTADFLIINPGGYTHTSIALRDAILGIAVPCVEIHISNIFKRESFRHHSYISDIAVGCVMGLGVYGYELAAQYALKHLQSP